MWKVVTWKYFSAEDERENSLLLCKISNTTWKRNKVLNMRKQFQEEWKEL